jgi:hypothetical protein
VPIAESTIPPGGWGRGEADYLRSVRAACRALSLNLIDVGEFNAQMLATIDRGLTRAWGEGMAECGLKLDEMTPEERQRLNEELIPRLQRVDPLADFIIRSRGRGVALSAAVSERLRLWANDYRGVRQIGAAMACGNRKKLWQRGPTKEPCKSCLGFANRVYRYSTWLKYGALPQQRALCCHGYRCMCRLVDTDRPITRGAFPAGLMCG